jgi:hypothetical protein|tara:strand:- start:86 stop:637 length:552 start_codon:yes stop_codon:yes gene_type:complete
MASDLNYSLRPIGQLGVKPNNYADIFYRERHLWKYFCDENEPYFSDAHRLSAYELGELENWSDSFISCLKSGPKNETEKAFIECAIGDCTPKTISEQIILKLVYQALALGGLHCRFLEPEEGDYDIGDPLNDIDGMAEGTLRSFLFSIREKMGELIRLSAGYAGSGISKNDEDGWLYDEGDEY